SLTPFAANRLLDAVSGRRPDFNGTHQTFGRAPSQIDVQESVVERRSYHFNAVGQHKAPLELTRGNAAMEVDAVGLVDLLAADDKLIVFELNRQFLGLEACHGQGQPQRGLAYLLDIVRRIAV